MILELETCTVDLARGRIRAHDGDERSLTTREAELLRYLAERPGQPVSRDTLLADVWGYSDAVLSRACDNAVRRLRTKIEADAAQPVHLITVHGHGYRFEPLGAPALSAPAPPVPEPPPLRLGDVEIDLARLVARSPRGEASLTAREGALIERLARAGGAVVDREVLQRDLWGTTRGRAVDNAVKRLRGKLEADPGKPTLLLTERGRGYRLSMPEPARVEDAREALLGREREVAGVAHRLGDPGWFLIVGPAGVGKTRVLRSAAARCTDPVWWVDLASARTASELADRVAAVFQLHVSGDAVRGVAEALARRGRCVLVLDNLEQACDAAPGVLKAWLAAAPRATLAGTSRIRLGLEGEDAIELEPLTSEAACGLFVERARAASSRVRLATGERDDLVALVEALDRLPLAIELAAARAAVLSPAQLLARLDRRLDLLDGLRTALDSSWALLEPPDQEALLGLALFHGGFDVDDAEALLGPDAVDRIQALRDASWIHALPGDRLQFGVYEAVRAYAVEARAARPDGGRAPELRWAGWLARLGDPDDIARASHRSHLEHRQVRQRAVVDLEAAAQVALRWDASDVAARCALGCAAVRHRSGSAELALDIVRDVLRAPDVDPRLRAWLLLFEARLLRALDRSGDALPTALEAEEVARRARDALCQGIAAQSAAACYGDVAEPEDALAAMARASEAFLAAGRPDLAAYARARIELRLSSDVDAPERLLQDALAGSGDDLALQGLCNAYLGGLAWSRNAPVVAARRYQAAAEAHRESGLLGLEVLALHPAMLLQTALGRHEEVEALGERVLACVARTGSRLDEAVALAYLGQSRLFRDEPERALDALQAARVALAGAPRVGRTESFIDVREADALCELGDPAAAAVLADRARAFYRQRGDGNLPFASMSLARCLAHRDPEAALVLAEEAVAELRARQQARDIVLGLACRGSVRAAAGDRAGARADLAEAETLAREGELDLPRTDVGRALERLRRVT